MLASKMALRRGLASAASSTASATNTLTGPIETKISRLPNGFSVASVELNGATSSIVLAYRAGSRYQQLGEGGLVHHLRNNIGQDSEKYLGVKLLWQLGSVGGNLNAVATKDIVAAQTSVVRDNSAITSSLIGEFSRPAFKAWNVVDDVDTVENDLYNQVPYDVVLELLHSAAYRNGPLANPVLAQPYEVGKISHHQLKAYGKARLVTGEAALVGVNVDHEELLTFGSYQQIIPEGRGTSALASPYIGGDSRIAGPSSIAHVIIAGEGAALSDIKAVAVQEVLAFLIGSQTGAKFTGAGGSGIVGKAVHKASNSRPVGVTAVNVSHSDTGLVGVYLAVEGQYAEPTVRAAYQSLKSLSSQIDADSFEAAKKSAQVESLLRLENPAQLALDSAAELLANGTATSPIDLAAEIGKVSLEDVKKAAQKIAAKPSISAYGRINQVPYLDQL